MNSNFTQEVVYPLHRKLFASSHEYFGYENYQNRIIPFIKNTYNHGESNSMMIIGKRGSGKTHLIRSLLNDLNNDDKFRSNVYQVNLNGLLQTDDKCALKSIALQLKCHLIENDEEEFTSDNFTENFEYILSFLKSGNRDSICLLFIIEEFDLFLQHKNQILIYNLLNSVQSKGTPIFVLGTTTRKDFLDLMEKRVKSRFSLCQIPLIPFSETIDLYVESFRKLLIITTETKSKEIQRWNESVKRFANEPNVLKILERNFMLSNLIGQLKRLLMLPIARLSPINTQLKLADFQESWDIINVDYKSEILYGLCELEFTFLAVIVNCIAKRESDVNFEMVYREYHDFCKTSYSNSYEKNVLRKCLDHLLDLDLIGMKKGKTANSNFNPLQCFILHRDLKECLKRKKISSYLQQFINNKLSTLC